MLTATAEQAKTSVFLTAAWRHLAMLNFAVDPALLEPFLPAGLELDFWHGRTYASVVGFQFLDATAFGVPLPFHGRFAEVNLRFYVVRQAPDGPRRGVVFLREIAPRWLISLGARWLYNERYVTMPMRERIRMPDASAAGRIEYGWRHGERWNGLAVHFDGEPHLPAPGSEAEFIVEHYWGYAKQRSGATMEYAVEHRPWRIWPAHSMHFDCDVAAIYGNQFAPVLAAPCSAFVADGSAVAVRRGCIV